MSVTAGTGGTGTVDTTGDFIFNASGGRDTGCTSIQLWCPSGSGAIKVRCVGVHNSGEELYLDAGNTAVIRRGEMGIRQVHVKGATTTATVHWGVVATTGASL